MPTTEVPGVYIEPAPSITASQVGGVDSFKTIILVTSNTGTGGTATSNVLTDVTSYTDFRTKFGTTCPIDASVKALFDNYANLSALSQTPNQSRVKVIRGQATTSNVTNDTLRAFDVLTALDDCPLGFLLAEEAAALVVDATTVTNIFTPMDTLCGAKGLLGLVNIPAANLTATAINTWANLVKSAKRNIAAFWGSALTGVSAATIAAIHALRAFDEYGQFIPPAGKYAIANSNPPALLTRADQDLVYPNRINFIKRLVANTGTTSDVIWGARMLSTDKSQGCLDMNTYVSSSVTEKTIARNIDVFRSIGFSSVLIELKATVTARLNDLNDAGAYRQDVVLTDDLLVNTSTGLQRLTKGTAIPSGFIVFDPIVQAGKAYIDFVYFPVTTLEQIVIRTSRVIL